MLHSLLGLAEASGISEELRDNWRVPPGDRFQVCDDALIERRVERGERPRRGGKGRGGEGNLTC